MSTNELKSEVIRLVNEMDGALMEDLLLSVKMFMRQQENSEIDTNSGKVVDLVGKSLAELRQETLLSNDEILNESKKWLTR